MRLFFIIFLAVLVSSHAKAQTTTTDGTADREIWNAACAQVGKVAESIIRHRLAGTSMSVLMKRTDETVGQRSDAAARDYAAFLKRLIVRAYASPGYTLPDYQERAVREFRNEVELACYSGGI